MSKFIIKILWFIGLVSGLIGSFFIELGSSIEMAILILSIKIIISLSLLIWLIGLNDTFKEIINIKYRIVDNNINKSAEYLTIYFIPIWKPIETKYHTNEVQNLYGATYLVGFSTEVKFDSEKKAIEAINKHKRLTKQKRDNWFSRDGSKKIKPNVKYL